MGSVVLEVDYERNALVEVGRPNLRPPTSFWTQEKASAAAHPPPRVSATPESHYSGPTMVRYTARGYDRAMKNALRHVEHIAREYLTHWMVTGAILAVTGAAPEHWLADLFHDVHLPTEALHLWTTGIDLRMVLAGLGLGLIVGDIAWRRTRPQAAPVANQTAAAPDSVSDAPPLPDKPSIAVLPFDNLSGDPAQEYFSDGVAEDIITGLSRLRWLFVIARNSSFTYKGQAVDIRRIADDLGVRYVLEGSVRRLGDRVRVTAQLIEAEHRRHVWAEHYDRGVADIFALQDEITDRIVATLDPEISSAERDRARRKPPGSLGAWELYQQGMWHLLRRNRDDFVAARVLFSKALGLDPGFATAHAALAISSFWQITHDLSTDALASRVELHDAAARALECDDRDFLAHSAMGLAFMELGQHENALAEHEIATTLNPNSAFAQWCYGYALARVGQHENALARFDLALLLSPRDPGAWSFETLRASALYLLGRYEEAVAAARAATRTQLADVVWPLVHLSASLGQLGRHEEAAVVIRELRRVRPGLTITGIRAWPHNEHRSVATVEKMLEGLRKAGLPEE
jgi:TolB-like protein/Flp pilus assembly protein TadD